VECVSLNTGTTRECAPANTLTLKSIEVRIGVKEKRDSTLRTARSPLYIEVGVCRTVVRHTCA